MPKRKFSEDQETVLNGLMWSEYTTGKNNNASALADFELALEMMECKRTEKDYDWLSDVFIPEFPSIMLTEASHEAVQYFPSRDFVDVFLEASRPQDVQACNVAKKIINTALNNKEINHYQKYMQAREINRLMGYVYAVCWWEQHVERVQVGVNQIPEAVIDPYTGQALMDEYGRPSVNIREEPVYDDVVLTDQFNWMPIDPRNVFCANNKYVYSPQEEDGIIIRSEKTYQELKAKEKDNGYINLNVVKEWMSPGETDTSQQSYNEGDKQDKPKDVKTKGPYDILERYGKRWVIVKERDKLGYPTKVDPGYGEDGEPKENAEYVLVRHTMAYKGGEKVTIRFQAEPLRDGVGRPYMPILRGLCYIHATKKNGMSSAKYLRELQIGLNDTVNMSNDRVKLATLPTFIGNKYMVEDNDTVYIEPEHTIEIENIDQFKELAIRDNIQGAMVQSGMFKQAMQQIESVYPTTMGNPGEKDITATAIIGSDQRSNIRNNYKSLTFEYTFLNKFYWMLLQMTWQYMHPKTQEAMFSQPERMAFNPVGDYTYQPITSNIEVEHSKDKKIKNYDQIIGRLAGLAQGNPAIIPILAFIVGRQLELLGDEFRTIKPLIDSLTKTPMQPEAGGPPLNQPADQPPEMTSNQNGLPVQGLEQYARRTMQ